MRHVLDDGVRGELGVQSQHGLQVHHHELSQLQGRGKGEVGGVRSVVTPNLDIIIIIIIIIIISSWDLPWDLQWDLPRTATAHLVIHERTKESG